MADAILAGVTVARDAFGDPRYVALAELCGFANHYEALGRMTTLWSVCTALETNAPPIAKIVVCLGRQGPDALIEADLGERLPDGLIRVKGCQGRTEWISELPKQQASAGAARAAKAQRDQRGRLLPTSSGSSALDSAGETDQRAGSSGPADSQRSPAQEQDQEQEEPERERAPSGLPDGWVPEPTSDLAEVEERTRARGIDVELEVAKFKAFSRAKRKTYADPTSALIKWLLGARDPTKAEREAKAERERAERDRARREQERKGPLRVVPDDRGGSCTAEDIAAAQSRVLGRIP